MLILNLQRFAGDKTEKATPRTRRKQRREGHVPQSRDLVSSLSFLISLLVLKAFAASVWGALYQDWAYGFAHVAQFNFTSRNIIGFFFQQIMVLIRIVYPFVLIPMFFGLIANIAQVQIVFLPNLLIPKFNRLNPISGIQRLFGVQGIVATTQSILKLTVIGGLVYLLVQGLVPQIENLSQEDASEYPGSIATMIYGVLLKISIGLVALSVGDYVYQRYNYEKKLKMSKDDVKQERKEMDGNPQIKGKIRKIGREIAAKRMMHRIPDADVVITNPTHFAVAIQYERGSRAPIVVAKGADEVAFRIRTIAREHEVPIVENKPLARELYKVCDMDDPVPTHLFKAVAELLAYVYRRRGRRVK